MFRNLWDHGTSKVRVLRVLSCSYVGNVALEPLGPLGHAFTITIPRVAGQAGSSRPFGHTLIFLRLIASVSRWCMNERATEGRLEGVRCYVSSLVENDVVRCVTTALQARRNE